MSSTSIPKSAQAVGWTVPVPGLDLTTTESCRDPNTGQESYFSPDGRNEVDDGDIRDGGKYRSVVKIQTQFRDADGEFVWTMGSGWLIRPDLLVTAGHVVYDHGNRFGATTQIKCYIGYHGRDSVGSSSVQARYGRHVVTTPEWVKDGKDRRHDLAFIQVHKPFIGDLRTFKFMDTPNASKDGEAGLLIGVVGYPGDKLVKRKDGTDDYGAQMYEEFKVTKFDVETQGENMIEYRISTFGGQSGAPILYRRQKELIAIGTHCYGIGPSPGNSGNSINGKWGNNYDTFTKFFNTEKAGILPAEDLHILKDADNTPSSGGDSGQESFGDFFRAAAKIGSVLVPIASPLLGPVGALVGAAAGGLLSAVAGGESIIDTNKKLDTNKVGPGERALLAQGALEAFVSMGNSEEAYAIRQKLEADWNSKTANINFDVLARSLTPALIRSALDISSNRLALISKGAIPAKPLKDRDIVLSKPESLKIPGETESGVPLTAFTKSLLGPTKGIAGQESILDWLGPVLKAATSPAAKALVNDVAQSAIAHLSNRLTKALAPTESIIEKPLTPDEQATRLLLKRAVLADMTLHTFMTLPQEKLQKIQKDDYETGEAEGLIDLIKTGVQKLGPVALKAAKSYLPTLLDAAARRIGVKTESLLSPEGPDPVSNGHTDVTLNSVPHEAAMNLVTNTVTKLDEEEAKGGKQSKDAPGNLDVNPDAPVREVGPIPDIPL